MKQKTRARPTRLLALLSALALLTSLSGCGSEPEDDEIATAGGSTTTSPDTSDSGESEEDFEDQMLDFTKCLRKHGVDVDDSGGGISISGEPGDEDTIDEAMKACEDLRPERGDDGQRPEMTEELKEKFLALSQCMRDKGYDFPDPEFGDDGGVRIGGPGGSSDIDPSDPQVEKDIEACHDEVGLESPPMQRRES